MPRRPDDLGISSSVMGFIRLTKLLLLWTLCPRSAIVAAVWSPQPHPHPCQGYDSLHHPKPAERLTDSAAPHYHKAGSVESSRLRPSIGPLPPPPPHPHHCRKNRRKRSPPPRKREKKNLKKARTVGYFFAGIAMLLQVAVVVFLLIKRKQMIGVVHKYDEDRSEWNGIHTPA